MLKIHSLSIEETDELTVQQLLMLCSIKRRKNQITKVFIEKMNDIKILDFIFILMSIYRISEMWISRGSKYSIFYTNDF